MPSLSAVGIAILALLIAAALFLMYEIGKFVGEKTAADKFPEAKKAAVQRSRSVLSGMFAEQLAPYLPNFPFSPTEAKFIGAPIDFLVFRGMDAQSHRGSYFRRSEIRFRASQPQRAQPQRRDQQQARPLARVPRPPPLTNSHDPAIEPVMYPTCTGARCL